MHKLHPRVSTTVSRKASVIKISTFNFKPNHKDLSRGWLKFEIAVEGQNYSRTLDVFLVLKTKRAKRKVRCHIWMFPENKWEQIMIHQSSIFLFKLKVHLFQDITLHNNALILRNWDYLPPSFLYIRHSAINRRFWFGNWFWHLITGNSSILLNFYHQRLVGLCLKNSFKANKGWKGQWKLFFKNWKFSFS